MKTIGDYMSTILKEIDATLQAVHPEKVPALAHAILEAQKTIVAGAGRSGLMIRSFCMRLMHMGLNAYVAGETVTPNLTQYDLFFIASGSGVTESLLVMAQKAKKNIGATLALITIDDNSPIAQLADIVLVIPAPSPKVPKTMQLPSAQPRGSLFEQALFMTLEGMVLMLMDMQGKNTESMFVHHANLE